MKALRAFLFFLAGLVVGWLVSGSVTPANIANSAAAHKHMARPVTTPNDTRFRSFAEQLPRLSAEEMESFAQTLAPTDRAAAINAMLAQSGPLGLSAQTLAMMREILTIWAKEDFDGAWAWCQQIEVAANRNYVASALLDQLVGKDPDRALALHLNMAARDPAFTSYVPFGMIKIASSKDAASFIDLLGKLPFDGSTMAVEVNFALDFDFQLAADGVTSLSKKQTGFSPPVFPSSFLSTWAERNADAAFAWFSKNPRLASTEDFCGLLWGIEKQGVPGASSAWAADKLNQPGAPREEMIRSLTFSYPDPGYTDIHPIAQAMRDTASRDRFLGDVMMINSLNNPIALFGKALTQMSTPEARLATLQRLGKEGRMAAADIADPQLQQWGLTREQVEQAAHH